MQKRFIAVVFTLAGLLAVSCQESDLATSISVDSLALSVVSGADQEAPAGELLPQPVVVMARRESGAGFPGLVLEISVVSGEGEVVKSLDTTDSRGTISIPWRLGLLVGEQRLRISGRHVEDLVVSATALSKPGTLRLVSGDGQRGFPGDTLAVPIVVALTDEQQAPIAGREVTAKVSTGSGWVIPRTTRTDSAGQAAFRWVVGPQVGEQQVTFLAATESPVRVTSTVEAGAPNTEVVVFEDVVIERGKQQISTEVDFPDAQYRSIQAELVVKSPCKSCGESNCDPWDRIGNVTIEAVGAGGETVTVELVKFITPFGNSRTYTSDLSAYGPLLRGRKTVRAYISTYVGRWTVTLKLRFRRATLNPAVVATYPLFFSQSVRTENADTTLTLDLPVGGRAKLAYRATGHNVRGRNCDEFCKKAHEIYVDGVLVETVVPWRDDCEQLLTVNRCGLPQSVRSSRAGWCPGDIVEPTYIDLGELSPGRHTFRIRLLNVEPNGGYWRVSLDLRVYR
jgi:hypothetical protein